MTKIYQHTVLILAGTVLMAYVGVQFVYMPAQNRLVSLQEALTKNQKRNQRIQDLAKNPNFFIDLTERIEKYHAGVKALLPKSIKLSGLLRELSVLAKRNQVGVISIKPLEKNEQTGGDQAPVPEGFNRADIQIIIECAYANLGKYIEAVENNELTVMTIKDLHIQLNQEAANPNKLEVTMTIEAFFKQS